MKTNHFFRLFVVLTIVLLSQVSGNVSSAIAGTYFLTLATGVDVIQWSDINGNSGVAVPTWVHPAWTSLTGASWVWNEYLEDTPGQGNTVTFTQVFSLPQNAHAIDGSIEISADNFMTLYLNGQLIAEVRDGDTYTHTYIFLLRGFLQPGENELKVVVENVAAPGWNAYMNPGGLLYRADINYDKPGAPISPSEPPVPQFLHLLANTGPLSNLTSLEATVNLTTRGVFMAQVDSIDFEAEVFNIPACFAGFSSSIEVYSMGRKVWEDQDSMRLSLGPVVIIDYKSMTVQLQHPVTVERGNSYIVLNYLTMVNLMDLTEFDLCEKDNLGLPKYEHSEGSLRIDIP